MFPQFPLHNANRPKLSSNSRKNLGALKAASRQQDQRFNLIVGSSSDRVQVADLESQLQGPLGDEHRRLETHRIPFSDEIALDYSSGANYALQSRLLTPQSNFGTLALMNIRFAGNSQEAHANFLALLIVAKACMQRLENSRAHIEFMPPLPDLHALSVHPTEDGVSLRQVHDIASISQRKNSENSLDSFVMLGSDDLAPSRAASSTSRVSRSSD